MTPGRRAQDLEEQAVVARVLAELLVDEPQIAGRRARMVEARTPFTSGFCCSTTNSSSSADGVRANTSSFDGFEVVVADLEARD